MAVKKGGPNRGRGFLTGKDCEDFFWLDTDYLSCPGCVALCPVRTAKRPDSPNLGRRSLSCPGGTFCCARGRRPAGHAVD